MKLETEEQWLPPQRHAPSGDERRVGVEIEYAGVGAETVLELVCRHYGGSVEERSKAEFEIVDTAHGDYKLELDAVSVKQLAGMNADEPGAAGSGAGAIESIAGSMGDIAVDMLTLAAEQLVPWEIVSPPIPVSSLHELVPLISDMRDSGALGTRHALRYAFGVHLNPELPALDAETVLAYMRAYFVLYDWIASQERVDTARKITPYIDHFSKDYIELLIAADYSPSMEVLIDDYIVHNPTRNRSLDMLPLFAHIDEQRVRSAIDDPRIKARPTFHYRLPNCDIDAEDWNLDVPWSLWLEVEKLAGDSERLSGWCEAYGEALRRLTHGLDGQWAAKLGRMIDEC